MSLPRRRARSTVLALSLAAAGCSPYVFNPDEFDRDAPTFNKPLTDREQVSVCYNGWGTSDRRVAELARAECGRFGKQAVLVEAIFGECPLTTPSEARFACRKVAAD